MKRIHSLPWRGLVAGLAALAGSGAHQVQPKATADDPHFAGHAVALPDGALLAYYVRKGTGPSLVLVPETHGDRTQFYEPTFLAGLDPDLQIVVIESRGQGRSWPPPKATQASIAHYASDVLAVVGELALDRWYIGGHSLGGMIALEIAGRRPPGLRGVIALEGWVHARVQRNAFPESAPASAAARAEARRQREERYRSQGWTAGEVAALGRIWTQWTSGEAIVHALSYPLLALWGDRGLGRRPSREQLLLPDVPQVQVRWIAGADHYVTDPPYAREVGRAITEFIGGVEAAQALLCRGPDEPAPPTRAETACR